MTFSLVICSDPPEGARTTIEAFAGFGERFESVVMTGAPTILDSYCEGLRRASHDLVVFAHNDLVPLTWGIEASLRLGFEKTAAGWIGTCGSLDPIACGCVFHRPWRAVGAMALGMRGKAWGAPDLEGRLILGEGPRYDVLGLMRQVAMLDGAFLATMDHSWDLQNTERTGFFSAYDADVSYEAVSKGRSLWVLPLPVSHFGSMPTLAEIKAKDAEFRRGITPALLERWKNYTVPCNFGDPPPGPRCPALDPRLVEVG